MIITQHTNSNIMHFELKFQLSYTRQFHNQVLHISVEILSMRWVTTWSHLHCVVKNHVHAQQGKRIFLEVQKYQHCEQSCSPYPGSMSPLPAVQYSIIVQWLISSLAIKADFTGCRPFHSSTLLLLLIACNGGVYTKFSKFSDDWNLVFEEAITVIALQPSFCHNLNKCSCIWECVQTLVSCCD